MHTYPKASANQVGKMKAGMMSNEGAGAKLAKDIASDKLTQEAYAMLGDMDHETAADFQEALTARLVGCTPEFRLAVSWLGAVHLDL